ncbi:MAG: preprotein translocase subunit YajC [Candidatus Omnitrophica bacterium]|nr:preprotein translocase subunit YajC [Candidatus Omnitrophota bacterium]MCM8806499.1 preprotein translocase subunit YajC [Candidatus Omnitrophota bacterium]
MNILFLAQAPPPQPSPFSALLPLILIFFVFYFLLILPQQKKEKLRKKMLDELKEGDKIVTIGGLIGEVEKIKDEIVTVKFRENTKIDIVKNAISQVIEKKKE